MFLEILSVAWSVYSSEPGELIATAIKCLGNEPRQYHSNVSGVFFFFRYLWASYKDQQWRSGA